MRGIQVASRGNSIENALPWGHIPTNPFRYISKPLDLHAASNPGSLVSGPFPDVPVPIGQVHVEVDGRFVQCTKPATLDKRKFFTQRCTSYRSPRWCNEAR